MKLKNERNLEDGVKYIGSTSGGRPRREHYLDLKKVEAGTYYIFIEFQWEKEAYSKHTYVLSSYGPQKVLFEDELKEFPDILPQQVLEKVFLDKCEQMGDCVVKTDMLDKGAPNIIKYRLQDYKRDGYFCNIVINNERESTYKEIKKYTFEGCKLLPPHKGTTSSIECAPGHTKFVI